MFPGPWFYPPVKVPSILPPSASVFFRWSYNLSGKEKTVIVLCCFPSKHLRLRPSSLSDLNSSFPSVSQSSPRQYLLLTHGLNACSAWRKDAFKMVAGLPALDNTVCRVRPSRSPLSSSTSCIDGSVVHRRYVCFYTSISHKRLLNTIFQPIHGVSENPSFSLNFSLTDIQTLGSWKCPNVLLFQRMYTYLSGVNQIDNVSIAISERWLQDQATRSCLVSNIDPVCWKVGLGRFRMGHGHCTSGNGHTFILCLPDHELCQSRLPPINPEVSVTPLSTKPF